METDRFRTHNAMIAGLKSGKGWSRPALFFTRSIPRVLSREEFEALILHEVSHVALRHVSKRVIFRIVVLLVGWVPLFMGVFAAQLMLDKSLQPLITPIGLLALMGAQIALSRWQVRYQEMEADYHGVNALGAGEEAMAGALRKLTAMNDLTQNEQDPTALLSANSGHPPTEERIRILRERLRRRAGGEDLRLDWEPYAPLLHGPARFALVPALAALLVLPWLGYREVKARVEFVQAANHGELEKLRRLIAAGRDVNAPSPLVKSLSPLAVAAAMGKLDAARLLLEHGADPEGAKNGFCPVALAARADRPDIIRLLLEHGAKVDCREPSLGQTPLMTAAWDGRDRAAAALIQAGADVNALDRHRSSPLGIAAERGHAGVARLLVARGAKLDVKDGDGDTPLGMAAYEGHAEIASLLRAAGASDLGRNRPPKPLPAPTMASFPVPAPAGQAPVQQASAGPSL